MKFIISKPYKEKRKIPKNFLDSDLSIFKHEFEKKIPKNYYFFSHNAFLFNEIIVNLKKLRIFKKYTFFGDKTLYQELKRIVKNFILSKGKVEYLDYGMWVTDHKSTNYFHWTLDSLQRALSVKDKNSKYPILLSARFGDLKFIIDFLETFSMNYLVLKENVGYRVKKLLITSKTAPTGNYHKDTMDTFRSEIFSLRTKEDKINTYENLFIIRNKNLHRSGLNMKKLMPILKTYNFKVIDFEELSVLEKINNLQHTKNLVGIFGSGLTNMIFMNECTNVLEIRLENDYKNNAFYSLANICKINYYYLFHKPNMDFDFEDLNKTLAMMVV